MRRSSIWPFLVFGAAVACFWAIGINNFHFWILDLGSVRMPMPVQVAFFLCNTVFGTIAVIFLSLAVFRLAGLRLDPFNSLKPAAPSDDRKWIIALTLLACLVPAVIRMYVLRGAALTDDESCYRFSAEVLADLRLTAPSPDMKLFFDRAFMINDGRLYSQYPLGWPLLLAPGTLFGISGYMNCLYFALSVPALYSLVGRLTNSSYSKVVALLWILSPMYSVAAATELSHTACTLSLVWALWFALRSREQGAPFWVHLACAACLSFAVCIRPSSGVSFALPVSVYWLVGLAGRPAAEKRVAVSSFLGAASFFGGLFLLVNWAQNGSPFHLSYQRSFEYARENGYRFSNWSMLPDGAIVNFRFKTPMASLGRTAVAVLRMNTALWGWPCSFALAFFAGYRRFAGLCLACVLSYLAIHFFTTDSGIDSFGPVHFFELGLPITILTVLGLQRLETWLTSVDAAAAPGTARLAPLPGIVFAASVAVASICYTPVVLFNLSRIAGDVTAPFELVERANIRDTVIFSSLPITPQCRSLPTRHFVYWRPNNDPDLKNSVLWVNHLSVEEDRAFMKHYPGRRGYIMYWSQPCTLAYVPLEAATEDVFPPSRFAAASK